SSTEPAYLEQLRNAVAKAGSHIVDLGHGGRSFYHPDKAKRLAAVEFGKKGVDMAVLVGSPSLRQHITGVPGVKEDVNLTAETLRETAEYGEERDSVVNLENDVPVGEGPVLLGA